MKSREEIEGLFHRYSDQNKRWKANVHYRHQGQTPGVLPVIRRYTAFVEELDELADIIESGPDWNAIDGIQVTLNRVDHPKLTVEGSAVL